MTGLRIALDIRTEETEAALDTMQPVVNEIVARFIAGGCSQEDLPDGLAVFAAALINEGVRIRQFNQDGGSGKETVEV